MKIILLFLLLKVIYLQENETKCIITDYIEILNSYNILLSLSEIYHKTHFQIDLSLDHTWVYNNFYTQIKSKHVKKYNSYQGFDSDNNQTLQIEDISDNVYFYRQQIKIENFFFKTVEPKPEFGYSSIGFRYKNGDKNTTFFVVHQLKEKGMINKLIFSLVPIDYYHGKLVLGELPNDIIKYSPYKTSCAVDKVYLDWGCRISIVMVGGVTYINPVNHYAFFQTATTFIYAPETFMDFLRENVFDSYIKKNVCSYNKGKKKFVCNFDNEKQKFPNITFKIGDSYFTLSEHYLFDSSYGNKTFIIQQNTEKRMYWVLGGAFYKMNIISFDYENHSVSFYSNSSFNLLPSSSIIENKNISRQFLINFLSFTLITTCIILFISKVKSTNIMG